MKALFRHSVILLLVLLAIPIMIGKEASAATTNPISSLVINQDGKIILSLISPAVGSYLIAELESRPASRVQATVELQTNANEKLVILTALERPIFSIQAPNPSVSGREFQGGYVIQNEANGGTVVLTINGSLPNSQPGFKLLQMMAQNGEGLMEAINLRADLGPKASGSSSNLVIVIVLGALLALAIGFNLFLIIAKRGSAPSKF